MERGNGHRVSVLEHPAIKELHKKIQQVPAVKRSFPPPDPKSWNEIQKTEDDQSQNQPQKRNREDDPVIESGNLNSTQSSPTSEPIIEEIEPTIMESQNPHSDPAVSVVTERPIPVQKKLKTGHRERRPIGRPSKIRFPEHIPEEIEQEDDDDAELLSEYPIGIGWGPNSMIHFTKHEMADFPGRLVAWVLILEELSWNDLISLSRVCKPFRDLLIPRITRLNAPFGDPYDINAFINRKCRNVTELSYSNNLKWGNRCFKNIPDHVFKLNLAGCVWKGGSKNIPDRIQFLILD
eukprot:TRINITY_DN7379_c0_g2_i1.p1 TRINITY_DN7379_c0_g2~~TRINITY_DN7379_c0_g2_i1.p1  ORF type:complete len:293 (+),score=46.96 TRINITY_DN7379_c0_g2_i1:24-902(+)